MKLRQALKEEKMTINGKPAGKIPGTSGYIVQINEN